MNVKDWLDNLGMGRYAAAFHADGITAEVLPCLTEEDLKDVGVASIGHRRALLKAIAEMRATWAPIDEPGRAHREDRRVERAFRTIAERRQLSVMFCDLADSTALSSRLDPEDLSTIIRAYQSRVTTAVARFGGFVARYVGDGVLVYFGWPAAHESNAEQAVRAALAVIEAVAESPVGMEPLQVRIGIATGLVVVGEPIGAGEALQQTAIGRTPNLAARLQGAAQPGCLVIDAATRRQIGGLFECQDLAALDLKGFAEKVPAWQVTTAAHRSRSEALHSAASLVPLLGRDEELSALSQRWLEAKTGKGRVVMLTGEPGIGKSRLVVTLMERLSGEISPALLLLLATTSRQPALPHIGPYGTPGVMGPGSGGSSEAGPKRARPGASARGICKPACGGGCPEAGAHPVRGRALDRPYQPGTVGPFGPIPPIASGVARGLFATWVQPALGRAAARLKPDAQRAPPTPSPDAGDANCSAHSAIADDTGADREAGRRSPPLCRGADACRGPGRLARCCTHDERVCFEFAGPYRTRGIVCPSGSTH